MLLMSDLLPASRSLSAVVLYIAHDFAVDFAFCVSLNSVSRSSLYILVACKSVNMDMEETSESELALEYRVHESLKNCAGW